MSITYLSRFALACTLSLSAPLFAQDSFGQTPRTRQTAPGQEAAPPPQSPSGGNDAELVRMEAVERKNMGVAPKSTLHEGPMHAPTPSSIPGGRLVTTREIVEMVRRTRGDRNIAPRSFDILGGNERLPGALYAAPAGQAGSFDDNNQREFGQFLQGVMQGRKDLPMIFYCASSQCWLSYNAALRAINLGYTNVLWYRGGLEAWKQARLPIDTPPQNPGGPNPNGQGPGNQQR